MTRYYLYFPHPHAIRYRIIHAEGLEIARMERLGTVLAETRQALLRVSRAEAYRHLQRGISAHQAGKAVGARHIESAACFLGDFPAESHPLPDSEES